MGISEAAKVLLFAAIFSSTVHAQQRPCPCCLSRTELIAVATKRQSSLGTISVRAMKQRDEQRMMRASKPAELKAKKDEEVKLEGKP